MSSPLVDTKAPTSVQLIEAIVRMLQVSYKSNFLPFAGLLLPKVKGMDVSQQTRNIHSFPYPRELLANDSAGTLAPIDHNQMKPRACQAEKPISLAEQAKRLIRFSSRSPTRPKTLNG